MAEFAMGLLAGIALWAYAASALWLVLVGLPTLIDRPWRQRKGGDA